MSGSSDLARVDAAHLSGLSRLRHDLCGFAPAPNTADAFRVTSRLRKEPTHAAPRGLSRIPTFTTLGNDVIPGIVSGYLIGHAEVQVELVFQDHRLDLLALTRQAIVRSDDLNYFRGKGAITVTIPAMIRTLAHMPATV